MVFLPSASPQVADRQVRSRLLSYEGLALDGKDSRVIVPLSEESKDEDFDNLKIAIG